MTLRSDISEYRPDFEYSFARQIADILNINKDNIDIKFINTNVPELTALMSGSTEVKIKITIKVPSDRVKNKYNMLKEFPMNTYEGFEIIDVKQSTN